MKKEPPSPLVILSPLHRATRQVAVHFQGELAPLGIQSQEGHLLSYLASYAPAPVGELARVFGLSGSTLTSMLDRLERRGTITRRVSPDDRRSFLVELSAEGRKLARDVRRVTESFERAVLARLAPGKLEGFREVMAAIDRESRIDLRKSDKER